MVERMLAQVSFQVEHCKISGPKSQLHIRITFTPPSRICFLCCNITYQFLTHLIIFLWVRFIIHFQYFPLNWIIGPNSQPLPWTWQVHTKEAELIFPPLIFFFFHLLSLSSALKLALGNGVYTDVTQVGPWYVLAQLYMLPLVILPLAWDDPWEKQAPGSPLIQGWEIHAVEPPQFTHSPAARKTESPQPESELPNRTLPNQLSPSWPPDRWE